MPNKYIPHVNAYETELNFDRYDEPTRIAQIKTLLREGFLKIRFTKKSDGTERVLYGTTQSNWIHDSEKERGTKVHPEGVIPVYDIEAEGWRSFIIDNLIDAKRIHDPNLIDQLNERINVREETRLIAETH